VSSLGKQVWSTTWICLPLRYIYQTFVFKVITDILGVSITCLFWPHLYNKATLLVNHFTTGATYGAGYVYYFNASRIYNFKRQFVLRGVHIVIMHTCLSFFGLPLLIINLVSSNFSDNLIWAWGEAGQIYLHVSFFHLTASVVYFLACSPRVR